MAKQFNLKKDGLSFIRNINPKLMSYNVEMTEVTGGTFWKAYTKAQVEGKEDFPPLKSMDLSGIMQVYPPINLYSERVRKLAKEFSPVWVRVSGTWATKTYYDLDGHTNGKVPEGYQSVLTKDQWINLLEFVKAVGAKLLVSVNNCEGLHKADEPWHPEQAEQLFRFSKEYGVPVEAAEFMNEPNMLAFSGAPRGYTEEHYRRDQDLFFKWLKENYPEVLRVGPCTVAAEMGPEAGMDTSGLGGMFGNNVSTEGLMEPTVEPIDVYSYHYYNGISDRLMSIMPQMHWSPESTLSEKYLAVAGKCAAGNRKYRDKYCPGGEMWVTESGDAGGGGDSWASTYMDVFRTLNELGDFATITDGVIFHNTLASSAYGFLDHHDFSPRPNYWAVLLWSKLMGEKVYDTGIELQEGAHVFAHSRKDGKEGIAYLFINNSHTESTKVNLEKDAEVYELSADFIRCEVMKLNGRDLVLGEHDELPDLSPRVVSKGELKLKPETCTFIVM